MNKESKGYAIILYLIWPLSALFIALKNFDSKFGRNLLIALYTFLGLTAISVGDLERYESQFYKQASNTLGAAFESLLALQNGKFYNTLMSIIFGAFFQSHHIYFSALFLVYGYFLVKTIQMLKTINLRELTNFGLLFFFGLLLFFLLRPIPNLAFYTGGVFIVYNAVSYYNLQSKKYLIYILFTPLFHIGLAIYVALPVLLLLFKNKIWYYVSFVIFTFVIGQSSVVGAIEDLTVSKSETIITEKYNAYASKKGQNTLNKRYAKNEQSYNVKLQGLNIVLDAIWYCVPLGMVILYINRKRLLINQGLLQLFNLVLLFWGISNIMLNISQGVRFKMIFSLIAIGLFFQVYIKSFTEIKNNIFGTFLKLFVPILFLYGIMALIASHFIIPFNFFISNFFVELYSL
ncbi:hypothetical protein V5J73_03725 [Flavobacterium sp. KS-LB2]|uniref:hypothetical protein n=1 Tax=Flavobacterium sp. KS-LB2 TaxID=3120525 RepID=UPI0030D507B5